jgi:hypothetical protein
MASTSSSSESHSHRIWRRVHPAEVWMILATLSLLVVYLSIRVRISNYVFVAKWLLGLGKLIFVH